MSTRPAPAPPPDDKQRRGVPPDSRRLVGLLATPDRLRVVAAMVLGARNPSEIAERTGLSDGDVTAALARLTRGGLVTSADGGLVVRADVFATAARDETPKREPEDFGASDPAVTKILRAFLREGRLVQMPVPGRKRTVVLEYLAAMFEPGRRYAESEVNTLLRAVYDDYAAVRRYLVEEGFLSRDHGEYWRSGGWVDV